jgi:hypothetical protein
MSLVLQSSGGGQITIQEPATASNFTQTLPAVNGTVITTGNIPAGSVLQVVQSTNTGTFNTSSASQVSTGFTGTITPTSSTSRILVILNGVFGSSSTGNFGYAGLYRKIGGGSDSQIGNSFFLGSYLNNLKTISEFAYQFLDSPSTTSAVTYTLYAQAVDGGSIWVGRWGQDGNWLQPTTFTLLEIAA